MKDSSVKQHYCCSLCKCILLLFTMRLYCTSTPTKQYFCNLASLHKILEWIISDPDCLLFNILVVFIDSLISGLLSWIPNDACISTQAVCCDIYSLIITLLSLFPPPGVQAIKFHLMQMGGSTYPCSGKTTCCRQCNDLMVIVDVALAFLLLGGTLWNYLIRIWLDVRRNEVQPVLWLSSSSSFTSCLTSTHICQPPSSLAGDFRL